MNTETAAPAGVAVDAQVRPLAPVGVVAILTASDGRVLAGAVDFGQSRHGGFSLRDAQEMRARRALAIAAIEALASHIICQAIDAHDAEKLMRSICDRAGCRVAIIPVGHDAAA